MKPKVNLTNHDGNSFAIMATVRIALKKAGLENQIKEFTKKAMSGDYDNLLQTVMEYVDVE